ncbi:MAG TPA: choice-of-anchor P family protein [Vicinamibacterales bacterium]|jgi:hypothetical protein|nr:choice-of-anchor P family protein [Vicinamibacterales bacterium]
MQARVSIRVFIFGLFVASVAGPPGVVRAGDVTGQARGVQATTFGLFGPSTTVLADTGTLNSPSDARSASGVSGAVAAVFTSGVLHAASIGATDRVSSEASVADLSITVAGLTIGADFVMSRAKASVDGIGTALVDISGMTIGGAPVVITGEPNQTLILPGGRLVINEQQTSAAQSRVAALHLVIDGVADVIVASASATAR